ncbi:hypothetical protein [Veillonella parvula]|uniref:hypothetical protein n=1 Tax=Veillonella parvula TaxID=29466 RepID=UPI0039A1EB78
MSGNSQNLLLEKYVRAKILNSKSTILDELTHVLVDIGLIQKMPLIPHELNLILFPEVPCMNFL